MRLFAVVVLLSVDLLMPVLGQEKEPALLSNFGVQPKVISGNIIDLARISPIADDNDRNDIEVDLDGNSLYLDRKYRSIFAADYPERMGEFIDNHFAKVMIFRLRMPADELFGLGMKTREAYLDAKKVDPIDAVLWGGELRTSWIQWRLDKAKDLIEKSVFRSKALGAEQICLAIDSQWFNLSPNRKMMSLEDISFIQIKDLDGIVLEGEWEKPENKKLIARAREALAGTKVRMSVALDTRRNGKALDPLTQLLNLQGEKIDGIVVKVEDPADLPRAQAFVKDVLPEFEFGLITSEAATVPPSAAPIQAPK